MTMKNGLDLAEISAMSTKEQLRVLNGLQDPGQKERLALHFYAAATSDAARHVWAKTVDACIDALLNSPEGQGTNLLYWSRTLQLAMTRNTLTDDGLNLESEIFTAPVASVRLLYSQGLLKTECPLAEGNNPSVPKGMAVLTRLAERLSQERHAAQRRDELRVGP